MLADRQHCLRGEFARLLTSLRWQMTLASPQKTKRELEPQQPDLSGDALIVEDEAAPLVSAPFASRQTDCSSYFQEEAKAR